MNNAPAIASPREIIRYYPAYRKDLLYIRIKHPCLINVGCTQFLRYVDEDEGITIPLPKNDPSTIYINLPVRKPGADYKVEKVEHHPSYFEMDKYQRYNYLVWLPDIRKPTDIGNVYLYLCGLERKMFDGHFDAALREINLLRKFHGNRRFRMTSNRSMFHGCLLNKRKEDLENMTRSADMKVSGNYLLNMLYAGGQPLEPVHIYALTDNYPFFKNYRELQKYKAADPHRFIDAIMPVMLYEFSKPFWYFYWDFEVLSLPKEEEAVFINFNLYKSLRIFEYYDIINYKPFADRVRGIIRQAYKGMEDRGEV